MNDFYVFIISATPAVLGFIVGVFLGSFLAIRKFKTELFILNDNLDKMTHDVANELEFRKNKEAELINRVALLVEEKERYYHLLIKNGIQF